MSSAPDSPGLRPIDLALVATYPTRNDAHERGLVALSMGHPYWVFPHHGNFHLLVEPDNLPAVAAEVSAYDDQPSTSTFLHEENSSDSDTTFHLSCLYCFFLAAAFLLQKSQDPWSTESFANHSVAVIANGEWWRTATALALHGNLAHLAGNMLFGVWFFVLVARALGPWIALLGIVAAGILGNLLSSWIYFPAPTLAIGASTAVFGALGLLVGNGLHTSLRDRSLLGLSSKLSPLGGGLALLALTGAGGENTDLLAHCTGFSSGIALGLAATPLSTRSGSNATAFNTP